MAGSWNHSVDDKGRLLSPEKIARMLENGGDVWEYAEECYGMVYWLASQLHRATGADISSLVEEARLSYKEGLIFSPSNTDTP